MKDKITNGFGSIQRTCEVLGVALLAILCVLATLQIAFRYISWLDVTAAWTEELARYFFVMMILAGVPYTVRTGDNISIRPLLKRLSERWQNVLFTASNALVVLLSTIMVVSAYIVSQRTLQTTLATVDWLRIGYIHVVLAIAFLLAAVFTVEQTAAIWLSGDVPVEPEPDPEGVISEEQPTDVALNEGNHE